MAKQKQRQAESPRGREAWRDPGRGSGLDRRADVPSGQGREWLRREEARQVGPKLTGQTLGEARRSSISRLFLSTPFLEGISTSERLVGALTTGRRGSRRGRC